MFYNIFKYSFSGSIYFLWEHDYTFVTNFFLYVQRLVKHADPVLKGLEFGIQWWSWHGHTNASWDSSYSRQLWSCLGSHSYQSSRRGCSSTRLSVEVSRFQWFLQGRKTNHHTLEVFVAICLAQLTVFFLKLDIATDECTKKSSYWIEVKS